MTSEPASSSRPAMRLRTKAPWWTNTFRSSRGASRHELQSQLVAWSMLRSRRRKATYAASIASRSRDPSARPSSAKRKAASPSNFASRKGGSSRPTIVSRRSPAMAGACSISLPERYAV